MDTPVRLPAHVRPAWHSVAWRVALAALILFAVFLTVVLNRDGYYDSRHDRVSVLGAAYYATVALSTTGYGDIVPETTSARLADILIVTPLRILFLILLVGTTLEVLTRRTREQWRVARWRNAMRDHTVVIGYGTKGRSAVNTLRLGGQSAADIVVVDSQEPSVAEANADGLVAVLGDGTRSMVLAQAGVADAKHIVVAANRDDTAVLVTLTARQLNPTATIITSVREAENSPLLRQSGANAVVVSAAAAGRLLGLATAAPAASEIIEDLLVQGSGLDLIERAPTEAEIGHPCATPDVVLAVVRDGNVLRFNEVDAVRRNDVVVAAATSK